MKPTAFGLGLSVTALLAPLTAPAQPSLHEVVITASPLHTDPDMAAQAISSLSGDELRRRAGANLGETLEYQPGISNASFGPGVGVPVIRGQSASRVKVLENQLDTLDASSLSSDHALSIEPLLATRIEILRGPATLRYGSGAIGGVINVIDNRIPSAVPERTEGAVELRHNSVNDDESRCFVSMAATARSPGTSTVSTATATTCAYPAGPSSARSTARTTVTATSPTPGRGRAMAARV